MIEGSQDKLDPEIDRSDEEQSNEPAEDQIQQSKTNAVDEDLGWPIALRKGVRSCRGNVKYPISHYVKYEKLSHQYRSFITILGNIVIPNRVEDVLLDPGWKAAMDEEMVALKKNDTWELTTLPKGKKTVGCRWVFTSKFRANRTLERLKARLVAKGYT